MIARTWGALLATAMLLPAGSAAPADDAAPIFGKWLISQYQLAPWSRPEDAPQLNAEAKKLLKLQVTYSAKAVTARNTTTATAGTASSEGRQLGHTAATTMQ